MRKWLKYRPDIDGLRAVAVFAVIFFHAGFTQTGGGFVGVDVFFVISGFVITGLVKNELDRGEFSFASFYERRVRRLFPALFLVLTATALTAWMLFLPFYFVEFGKGLMATLAFSSNILLWTKAGYFESFETPLLHTWSLSVEEQFYLLFPLFLVLTTRYLRRYVLHAVLAVLAISLALSTWGIIRHPEATFFLAPTRAWELMLGAVLALAPWLPTPGRLMGNLLSVLGLAMVLGAVFLYSAATPFPGPSALLPCAGAALIIFAGIREGVWVNTVLSCRPLVFLGLISYSLYLWHWPIFVFARHYLVRELTPVESGFAIAVTFCVGVASYYLVERRFRKPPAVRTARQGCKSVMSGRVVFASSGGVALTLAAAAFAIINYQGFPGRFSPEVVELSKASQETRDFRRDCVAFDGVPVEYDRLCRLGDTQPRRQLASFLVWGDSHALSVLSGISEAAAFEGRKGLIAAYYGCPPLAGIHRVEARSSGNCQRFNSEVMELIAERENLKQVILVARWALCVEGQGYGNDSGETCYISELGDETANLDHNHEVFRRSLERTVRALIHNGKEVYIVASIPEVGLNVPFTLANAALHERTVKINPTLQNYMDRQKFVLDQFKQLQERTGVKVLYPHRLLCGSEVCKVRQGSHAFYTDGDHLSEDGSKFIKEIFSPVFFPGSGLLPSGRAGNAIRQTGG